MNRKKPVTLDKNENLKGYMFIGTSLIGVFLFSIFPLLLSFVLSFTDWNLISSISSINFVGLRNYIDMFSDSVFYTSLKNNILFAIYTIPVQLVFGLLAAVLINKSCYCKNVFKAVYFMPYISSTVAIATVWMFLFQPSFGPINDILKSIGIANPPNWLTDRYWALPSVAAMYSWQNIGYDIIIFIAGLQAIPQELYKSSDIDGANWFNKLRFITLPIITPTLFFLMITEIMSTFRVFDQIQVLTEGGPGNATSVLVYYLYKLSFRYNKIGYGSAMTVMLFVIIFAITFAQWKGRNKWVEEE